MSTYTNRFQQLKELLAEVVNDPEVTAVVSRAVDEIDAAVSLAEDGNLGEGRTAELQTALDAELAKSRALGEDPSDAAVLEWVRSTITAANLVVNSAIIYDGAPDYWRRTHSALREALQDVTASLDREAFRSRIDVAVAEAEDAAEKAKDAAGVTGGATLSEFFSTYAKEERTAAATFRWLAVGCVAAAIVLAATLPHPSQDDWVGLAYRFGFLIGVGALATYFGRQAGQHRRIYNWAKSLEVQLKSLPAFVAPVDDDLRDEIYRLFATRLLGGIPENRTGGGDDMIGATQVIELASTIARRGATAAP